MDGGTPNSPPVRPVMVSMHAVRTLIDAVAEAGVARHVFVRAAEFEPAFVQTPDARIPRSKLYELFELALDLTGDPAFGLHSIERLASEALDPIGALVVHAATLGEALRSIQEFRRLFGDEASSRVHEDGGRVILQVGSATRESIRVRRFMAEVAVAGLFGTMQRFRVEEQIEVCFESCAPDYHREYARIFKGRARFGQPFTGLCFDKRILAAAGPHPDAELHQALRAFAARRLVHQTQRLPYAARVHQVLVWQRPPRDMSMRSVARTLGLSERSLRRQLSEEKKSYSQLVNEALAFIARTCLLDERRSITETAAELGFANNTSFHRAFKRWTGLTPIEYRKQQAATAHVNSRSSPGAAKELTLQRGARPADDGRDSASRYGSHD